MSLWTRPIPFLERRNDVAKKARAKKAKENGQSSQAIVNEILDREGALTPAVLVPKVQAIKPDAKPASIGQCLHKWRKAKGLVGKGRKKGVAKAATGKRGRPARTAAPVANGSLDSAFRLLTGVRIIVQEHFNGETQKAIQFVNASRLIGPTEDVLQALEALKKFEETKAPF